MTKLPIYPIVCCTLLALAIPLITMAQDDAVPDITYRITSEEVEVAYNASRYTSEALGNKEPKTKEQILDLLVTQKIIIAMFGEYGMEIPEKELQSIENSYLDFEKNYQVVLDRGSESEIAYLDQLRAIVDGAREASGLSKEEYETFSIEQAKAIVMKGMLLREKFDDDTAKMERAIDEFVSSGRVNVEGQNYTFKAEISDK